MTISSTISPSITYNGNGVVTAFPTTYVFLLEAHLVVTLIDSGGTETIQTLNVDYTVSGGAGADGTVNMAVAPASGEQLRIVRDTTKTQLTDYVENDSFPAASHERALDKLTLIVQELGLLSGVSYPITVDKGGTGADNAADARVNLGLEIGTDVQAYSSVLDVLAGLSTADGNFIVGNGSSWVIENGSTARASLGLGSMAIQSSSSVSISGGTIVGITDLAIADGGTGSSTASGARANLGIGTMGTQNSSSVSITGGSITGITDITVSDGGTGKSSHTAYSVVCGGTSSTDPLQSVSGVGTSGQVLTSNGAGALPTWQTGGGGGTPILGSPTLNNFVVGDGANWQSTTPASSRTALGLGSIATQDASSVTITGGSITGITDLAIADGGTGASTAAGARTALGLVIGTDVQAYDQGLNDISGLAVTNGNFIVGDGVNWVAESGATARTSLGLGSIATQDSSSVSITGGTITGITDITVADGGTGRSSSTAYSIICGGTTGTGAQQSVSGVGTSGQVLTSNGASTLPTWQDAAGGGGAWEYVSTSTASSSSTIEFTGLSSSYIMYKVIMTDVHPASDFPDFWFRTSTDNGSTWDSGSSDYGFRLNVESWAGGAVAVSNSSTSRIHLARELGTGANENLNGIVYIFNPSGTEETQIQFQTSYRDWNSGVFWTAHGAGVRLSAADVDGIQFLMSGGNIDSGEFRLYGLTPS